MSMPSRASRAARPYSQRAAASGSPTISDCEVLAAPARFFLNWDAANPSRAYAAGSPNGGTAHAFVSRDFGATWQDITGTLLAPRTVLRLQADDTRLGVVYAATDDGVWRHYGGGLPACLDTRGGFEELLLSPGVCPLVGSQWAVNPGDAIAFDPAGVTQEVDRVNLGEVECLIAGGDVAFTSIDTPEPALGRAIAILARPATARRAMACRVSPRRATAGALGREGVGCSGRLPISSQPYLRLPHK